MLRITFVLPGRGQPPAGGNRVVYEYANRLSERGHQVTVLHVSYLPAVSPSIWRKFRNHILRYIYYLATGGWRPSSWFEVVRGVRMIWIPALKPYLIPDADIIVATWWLTAEKIALYSQKKGEKFYLIQGVETWEGHDDRVFETWHLPFKKIVISRWLQDIFEEIGEKTFYIPNALDFDKFGIDIPLSERNSKHIAMLYHLGPWKGSEDGIAALKFAKEKIPELTAELFGVSSRPEILPNWIKYRSNPSQSDIRAIYNRASIFLAPSHSEGWGLTVAESMACGCAVVATNIGGHREFSEHKKTALLVPVHTPKMLAKQIIRLVRDRPLRIRLARCGAEHITEFKWDNSVSAMEKLFMKYH